jgi:hypothetical protein
VTSLPLTAAFAAAAPIRTRFLPDLPPVPSPPPSSSATHKNDTERSHSPASVFPSHTIGALVNLIHCGASTSGGTICARLTPSLGAGSNHVLSVVTIRVVIDAWTGAPGSGVVRLGGPSDSLAAAAAAATDPRVVRRAGLGGGTGGGGGPWEVDATGWSSFVSTSPCFDSGAGAGAGVTDAGTVASDGSVLILVAGDRGLGISPGS